MINPGGLVCEDLDISAETYGEPSPSACLWAMQVKDGKFVVLKPKGANTPYWTGDLVGRSVTEATTTTAAP
jgi:hypothetical protein